MSIGVCEKGSSYYHTLGGGAFDASDQVLDESGIGRIIPIEIGKSFYSKGKLETGSQKGKYEGLTGYIFSTGKPLKINNITDKNEIGQISDSLSWEGSGF